MKFKKLTAMLCVTALSFSLTAMPAAADTVESTKYMIINDHFGNDDQCGWERDALEACKVFAVVGTEEIENGNYALTYESTKKSSDVRQSDWSGEHLIRSGWGNEIAFSPDVNVVIKTRIKSIGTGRSFLKINEPLMTDSSAWNYNWGTLFCNDGGNFFTPNGWKDNTYATQSNQEPANIVVEGLAGKWYDVKIVIHGNTKTASYEITPEDGTTTTISNMNIDYPDVAEIEEGKIEKLVFRLRNAEKLYVDYVQLWKEGVRVTSASAVAGMDNIDISLTGNSVLLEAIKDYVDLYSSDGATLIETSKSFDSDTNVLKLVYAPGLTTGDIYKVRVDTDALYEDLMYAWDAENELSVQAPECAAFNLDINGELVPGTRLEGVYTFVPEDASEDTSEFIWYTVDEKGEKTVIEGQTEKYFNVTEDYVDSVITYSMIPGCVSGRIVKSGVSTDCSKTVTPLSVPVIANPGFSPEKPIAGYGLSASYDYYDADGDEEENSVITWYKSDSAEGEFEEFATGKTIDIKEEYTGMYFKYTVIPKSNSIFRNEGILVSSPVSAPASDIISSTNLFVNGGAEDGVITPWDLTKKEDDYSGLSVVEDENGIYSGNYAFRMHPRLSNSNTFWQEVTLGAGKTYIVSAMLKSATADEWTGLEAYVMSSNSQNYTKPYRMAERTSVSDEWTRVSLTLNSSKEEKYKLGWLSFNDSYAADAYIDDMYVGELMISDIVTNNPEPVVIPKQGEKAVKVSILTTEDGKILNQFGEQDGLLDQKAVLSVSDVKGVSVADNEIYIDSNAVAGNISINVKCIPDYNLPGENGNTIDVTPAQSEFVKTVEVELVAHDDKTPSVQNINVSGVVAEGNTLTATYDFYQVDGKTDASTKRWLYSDTDDGKYYEIPGASEMNYTVTSEYADKFIKFAVMPKTTDGITGEEAYSYILAKPTEPYADEIIVSGDFSVGGEVTGNYNFNDYNRDNESTTTFKWYVSDTRSGEYTEISGENGKTLALDETLINKYIKFAVTPVSDTEPAVGREAFSDAFSGPVAPVVKNVSISANGTRLSGNYEYCHEYNARENGSVYEWKVDGVTVSTTTSYNINFVGTKTVTFTVTPVGDTNPATGTPVTASVVITGTGNNIGGNAGGAVSGGAGGVSGGSSFGSGSSSSSCGGLVSGVVSINDMDYVQESADTSNSVEISESDIDDHWGAEYLRAMEERGVMGADKNGMYNPDELVNRRDMLTYLFKTLKLEPTEYSGMFEDVENSEFAEMLQTMVDNGTISADTTFRPNDSISREEVCKILYISLENADMLENVEENLINGLSDYSLISDWAVKYVNTMYGIKMMIGISEDKFAPRENITKAQAATLLTRIIALVGEE